MTNPCPNCGETLPEDAYRCPVCDALAPAATPDDGAPTEAMPWAIPIRDGHPPPPAAGRDPLRPVLYGVLLVAFVAGLVVIAAQVLGGGDDGDGDGEPELAGDAVDLDGSQAGSSSTTRPDATTTTTSAAEATTTTEPTTTSTSTTAPPTTTTAAPTTTRAATPGSAPQLASSYPGGWVAQLTSVPVSAGSDAVERAWSMARSYASGAVVTRSDDWSSLQAGFWVIVDEGPFRSPDEVQAFCASIGDSAESDCLPRELSGRR